MVGGVHQYHFQDTEAPDEAEIVCAARNNNGIGHVEQKDKTRAKYGRLGCEV